MLPAERARSEQSDDPHAIICECCGNPFTSAHKRRYCSDECRSAANKDQPALDPLNNKVWCVSLAGGGRYDAIPCGHPTGPKQLWTSDVFAMLEPLLFSDRLKIGHNLIFDLLSVEKYFDHRVPPGPYGDTMVLTHLHNENLGRYDLGSLAKRYVGYEYTEKLGEKAYYAPFDEAVHYSAIDAKMAWRLWQLIGIKHRRASFWDCFDREMAVLEVLLAMRVTGAYVDTPGFHALLRHLRRQNVEAKRHIAAIAGDEFNVDSPVQLGAFLRDDLHLPITKRTANTDSPATDAATLKSLAKLARTDRAKEAIDAIGHYKEISKLLSTYAAGFIPHIDADSRIRCSYNQASVVTGRLSASKPNLQNIPTRRKDTAEANIRQLFTAPTGYRLIVADYNQIELRVLAHRSSDPVLLQAFRDGTDLHALTASRIYKVPVDQVTKEQRVVGKTANFAFIYGSGAGRIAEMAGISLPMAKMVLKVWRDTYWMVEKWGNRIKIQCRGRDSHYVASLYGRKRRLPDIISDDLAKKAYAERQAVNHPITGTAADIAKIAMIQVHRAIAGYDARLILQVHDELVIECRDDQVDAVVPLVKVAMEDVRLNGEPVLSVPLVVDINVADNWDAAK
jgi:DNA polymerase-1